MNPYMTIATVKDIKASIVDEEKFTYGEEVYIKFDEKRVVALRK